MSAEHSRQITDIFKWLAYGAVMICCFILSSTYLEVRENIKSIQEKTQSIESRVIRMEYELKLK